MRSKNQTNKASVVSGFSLMELIIALAVISLLITVALPNYNEFIAKRRADTLKLSLMSALALARNEAVIRGESVLICGIPKGQTKCPETAISPSNWSAGWSISYLDEENKPSPTRKIIQANFQPQDSINIKFNSSSNLEFGALGELESYFDDDKNFVISDDNSNQVAALVLRATGRLRSCVKWDEVENKCKDS